MSSPTFNEVERLVSQLPPPEQLQLAKRIYERHSEADKPQPGEARPVDAKRRAEIEAWLAKCDAVAEGIVGRFDSAEDIRQIREERASRI